MIALPAGVKVWLAAGATDMRKGFDGLAALVQVQLAEDPFSGQLFVFRGRAGDRVKILWWSGDGLCLFSKRLERGKFVWPHATHGSVSLSGAQLSMLLEGIDWRRVERTFDPQLAVRSLLVVEELSSCAWASHATMRFMPETDLPDDVEALKTLSASAAASSKLPKHSSSRRNWNSRSCASSLRS